jgi:Tyrosine phosphatase family
MGVVLVENFRPVAGTRRLYRCASTDGLVRFERRHDSASADDSENDSASSASSVSSTTTTATTARLLPIGQESAESIILSQAGLIVDLRSQMERDEVQALQWMTDHGFEAVDVAVDTPKHGRHRMMRRGSRGDCSSSSGSSTTTTTKMVLRIDVQPRERIIDYLTKHWLTPVQQGWNAVWTVTDTARQHAMRMDVLNERGLVGLYEAILETGGDDLCLALQHMTEHLEMTRDGNDNSVVVFHCVQGKDRYVWKISHTAHLCNGTHSHLLVCGMAK